MGRCGRSHGTPLCCGTRAAPQPARSRPAKTSRCACSPRKSAADRELLKLVLHNLILNAAQAMQQRGEIVVTTRRTAGWVELRIIDRGPGVPEDARAHVFEPFFTTKHRGTGLGLATARQIVEAH